MKILDICLIGMTFRYSCYIQWTLNDKNVSLKPYCAEHLKVKFFPKDLPASLGFLISFHALYYTTCNNDPWYSLLQNCPCSQWHLPLFLWRHLIRISVCWDRRGCVASEVRSWPSWIWQESSYGSPQVIYAFFRDGQLNDWVSWLSVSWLIKWSDDWLINWFVGRHT